MVYNDGRNIDPVDDLFFRFEINKEAKTTRR